MESISRISSMLETSRDLTLEAAQSTGLSRSLGGRSARESSFIQIKKLLDSRNDREILEGLRKVISMMYRTKSCLPYFSSVVKNVANPSIEIKKLVYIYLLHYAESEPDLALLSINTIQKSLSDQNPQIRAMALRVMSGIRVPVISQIVSLGIKKGCGDMSPHVRKAAALAISKCYRLDPSTLPQLLEYLSILLGDKQYYVVGSAVTSFLEVCPERIDLIHKHYRALVRKLVDMDDWGQLALIRLMMQYCRKCFQQITRSSIQPSTGFYDDEATLQNEVVSRAEVAILNPDLELFLKACRPLLRSRNPAVILAVTRGFLHLATPEYLDSAIGPLVALARSSYDLQHIVLYNIVSVCLVRPASFVPYASHFFIRATDSREAWRLKFEMLTLMFPHCEPDKKGVILTELEHFTKVSDRELVRESVKAIGRCAQRDSKTSSRCLNLLLKQTTSADGNLVSEALTVIRHLIQQDPPSHNTTVIRLAKNLDTLTNPNARAGIIWLVGEFAGVGEEDNIAPDVLRILAKGFADESETAKLQIVLLAAKVYTYHLNRTNGTGRAAESRDKAVLSPKTPVNRLTPAEANDLQGNSNHGHTFDIQPPHPIAVLFQYIILQARYDTSYDLRDRTRFYKALLADPASTQLASLLLLASKPVPFIPSPSESRKKFLLGSASLVIGKSAGPNGLMGYEALPDWVTAGDEPDATLRDEVGKEAAYGEIKQVPASEKLENAVKMGTGNKGAVQLGGKERTLDDWLAEEESGEDSSEETGEEDDEEESDDEETEEEETEGEDESEGEPDEIRLVS